MALAKGRRRLLIWTVSLVQLAFPAYLGALGARPPYFHANRADDQERDPISGPDAALKRAIHFADLYNWSDAAPFFAQAEESYRTVGDERNVLYAHLGKIRSMMEQLSLPEVSEELGTTLENNPLMRSDKELRLLCLTIKGDIDGEIDATPMRRDWEEALRIATELRDQKWINRASAEIGFAMFLQGDVMSARQKVAGGVIGASMLHDVGAQIRYLASIGTALVYLDSYDQALSYLDKALKLAADNPDAGYPFLVQEGRLQAFRRMGKLDLAQQLAEEVIREASARQKYVKQTQALITAAVIARIRHDDAVAVADLQSALDLAAKGGFKRLLAHAQFELADIYRAQGKIAEAKELAAAAAETTQQVGDLYLVPGRLQALGDLQSAQQQYAEADATYDRASDILDTIIGNVTAAPAKLGVVTAMSDLYVRHFALLADHLHNTSKAYLVLEHARGRVITDLLMSGNRADTAQERVIERTIGRLNLELSKAKSHAEIRNIRDKIFLAEQGRWVASGSGPWKSKPMAIEPLETVEQSLSPKEVVLEYVLAEPRSYCLVITHNGAHIVMLASRQQLEETVGAFLKKLKAKQAVGLESAYAYAALLKDMPELTKERWIIVPDGRLHLIPFEALRDKSGRYMVHSHIITYAPSATSMYLVSKKSQPKTLVTRSLLAIGGIPYDQKSDLNKVVVKAGYIRENLDVLPGSKREVLAADAALHSPTNRLLLGEAATESAFKHVDLDEYKVVHLAVHGVADEKNPDHAALILLNDPAAGEDGILQPYEIMQLRTNADLVVLSACDTAVGHLQGQEGVANISRAFLLAGARNVISTLWSTDDIFSAYLMKQFYGRLAAGETVADALTGAKREVLRTYGDTAIPFYWAGFTLEGLGNYSISGTQIMRQRRAHVDTKQ
jgi:CHAT domain-containing protein